MGTMSDKYQRGTTNVTYDFLAHALNLPDHAEIVELRNDEMRSELQVIYKQSANAIAAADAVAGSEVMAPDTSAILRVTPELLAQVLLMPGDWRITDAAFDPEGGCVLFKVSGQDLPSNTGEIECVHRRQEPVVSEWREVRT